MEYKTIEYKNHIIDIDHYGDATNATILNKKYIGTSKEMDDMSHFIGEKDGFLGIMQAEKYCKTYIDKYA